MKEDLFTGVREKWKPLYANLAQMARQAAGDYVEYQNTHGIVWKNGVSFAGIRARKDGIILSLTLETQNPKWKPIKAVQRSKNQVELTFLLADDESLPSLMEPIREAYALAKAKRPAAERPDAAYATVDEYIAAFPADIKDLLKRIRSVIREAAPDAVERISWQMPTYYQKENLVHFAAQKHHIGFYPTSAGIKAFADQLRGYKCTKGGVQFPLNKPIPYDLIAEITRFRVNEVLDGPR